MAYSVTCADTGADCPGQVHNGDQGRVDGASHVARRHLSSRFGPYARGG